ncbi:MAG TPA: DUF4192 domain-containing protein [Candidatus Yaniella excrementigallinarum]|nr:DUF4192 domain-containing protein [Candidatus Yaniella excrementigallinarum]
MLSHNQNSEPSHFKQPETSDVDSDFTPSPQKSSADKNPAANSVRATSPEDLLAYVQCTLGFRPKNSFIVVALAGQQLSTVVRCDLPESLQYMLRSDTPECVTYMDLGLTEAQELQMFDTGRYVSQLMAKEPSTTSCVVVYLPDNVTVSDQQALSVAGSINSIIAAQFRIQQIPVEESWFIHHDTLWHLRCAATTDCAVQGRDVGNPELTQMFRTLDPQRVTSVHAAGKVRQLIFPPVQDGQSLQPKNHNVLANRPKLVLNWLKLWDDNVSNGPRMLDSRHVADMLTSLVHPQVREAVQALACFDTTTAIRGMLTLDRFPAQIGAVANLQKSVPDGVAVKDAMYGQSDRGPDWHRVGKLERLCHQLLPLADVQTGGVVAGILVWIEWIKGRGSIAMNYVQQAREHYPAEYLLITLERYLRDGKVAGWATRTESAWSPQHAA